MKKNNSRYKNEFSAMFWLAIFLLFAIGFYAFYLFYNNFFRSLSKINEEPVATVTFKQKTAQRRFLDRNVWDRLSQNSFLYNGDTIHTAELSEAIIWFNDGTVMELSENTMAQIFFKEGEGLVADIGGGAAVLDSTNSTNAITLKSAGVNVEIEKGSSMSVDVKETSENTNAASFNVLKGNAKVGGSKNQEGTKLLEGQSVQVAVEISEKKEEAPEKHGFFEKITSVVPNISSESAVETAPVIQIVPSNLSVLSPVPNQKFLYHKKGKLDVEFAWTFGDGAKILPVEVVVASDKNFSVNVQTQKIQNETKCTFALDDNSYYWKIKSENNVFSGKIQLIRSLPPVLVTPVYNYTFAYRLKNPTVRFIWEESLKADSYMLEIADNVNFENPIITQRPTSASAIITTLEEGKYYWRVTPFYTINKIGYAAQSETGVFSISKKVEIKKPILNYPVDDAVINIIERSPEISFSWKKDTDAKNYTIYVSTQKDLSNPIETKTLAENYYKFEGDIKKYIGKTLYWGVKAQDLEGKSSPMSNIRSISLRKEVFEQFTIEPVDNFEVSEKVFSDVRFSWKKKMPSYFQTRIEVATDFDFSNIVVSQLVTGNSTTLKPMKEGVYYWRIKTFGKIAAEGSDVKEEVEFVTPPKKIIVEGKLALPRILQPSENIVTAANQQVRFAWDAVKDADYYTFKVLSEKSDTVLVNEKLKNNFIVLDMYTKPQYVDGASYVVQVQAFENLKNSSAVRSSDVSTKTCKLKKLNPVEITSPREGMTYTGINAIINPPSITWTTNAKLSEAQVIVQKIDGKSVREIMRSPMNKDAKNGDKIAPKTVRIETADGLKAGTYKIIVYAKTVEGIDISTGAKNVRTFKVLPIQNLEMPKNLKTTPNKFDAEYLRNLNNPRKIEFTWGAVAGATNYEFEIYKKINPKKNNLIYKKTLNSTKYSIDFTALKDSERAEFLQGEFIFSVQAIRKYDTDKDGKLDKILQKSQIAYSEFETDIPMPKKTTVKGAINPYGE